VLLDGVGDHGLLLGGVEAAHEPRGVAEVFVHEALALDEAIEHAEVAPQPGSEGRVRR
jgi:hypothetical protein